jgi:hypothetical protein
LPELVGALARSFASVVLLVVAYYNAPLNQPLDLATALLFGTALLALGVVVGAEVRGILRSARPRLRAARVLLVGVPMFLVVFAAIYVIVGTAQEGAFTEPLNRTDGLYFAVTVFATVGFGDIAGRSELARILVTIQMIIGLLIVGVVARLVVTAVHVAESRHGGSPLPGETDRG